MFSGTINPNNKDTLIHLAECMLINLDELENLNRTEMEHYKGLITKTHIRIRKAYGRNKQIIARMSIKGNSRDNEMLDVSLKC